MEVVQDFPEIGGQLKDLVCGAYTIFHDFLVIKCFKGAVEHGMSKFLEVVEIS